MSDLVDKAQPMETNTEEKEEGNNDNDMQEEPTTTTTTTTTTTAATSEAPKGNPDDEFDADSSDDDDDGGGGGGGQQQQQEEEGGGEGFGSVVPEGGAQDDQSPPVAETPDSLTNLRACKRCGLVKAVNQFYDNGCENCPFFDMVEDMPVVMECTSGFYGGIVSIIEPGESWMAKFLQLKEAKAGCYAMSITGTLKHEYMELVESRTGNRYVRCTEDGVPPMP